MTRKILALIVLSIFALFLQEALFPLFLSKSFVPNLLLILVLYLGFFERNTFGALAAFIIGLLLDLSGAMVVGPWAGAFVVTFCALSLIADRLFSESSLAIAVVGFGGAAAANAVFLFLAVGGLPEVMDAFWQVMAQAFVALVMFPILIPWIRWVVGGQRSLADYR